MVKNILSAVIFIFSISFFYFVGHTYFSDTQEILNKKKREMFFEKLKDSINVLPFLVNNTDNVIKYNSDFEKENNTIKRSFWDLFQND
ncbi:hypothetical protein OAB59_03745 [Pelagibacteraceae bacterium]|nr:hypothetical protein [Pelagibacteraceae bacterium]